MSMEDQDTNKKIYQFAGELLDDLSVDELTDRIMNLQLEVSRCESEITARRATNEAAESVFRK